MDGRPRVKCECAQLQSSELLWNTFPLIGCSDCPIGSFDKHAGSACSKINRGNTALLWNLFLEQPRFLGKCDITKWLFDMTCTTSCGCLSFWFYRVYYILLGSDSTVRNVKFIKVCKICESSFYYLDLLEFLIHL